jgi:RNA-directed DNA polymerase
VPKPQKPTAHLPKLKEIFRRYVSQPVGRVIELINPILRGWVHYFAVGHSSRCFSYIKLWVEKKVWRDLMRAREHKRIRLEAVEYAMALQHTRSV